MTSDPDNLLADLDALADRLDHRAYPGQAWTGPSQRPFIRRILWPVAAAAAVAALVVLGILLRRLPQPGIPVARETSPDPVALPEKTATMDWSIPTDFHVTGLSRMTAVDGLSEIRIEPPRVSAPSSVTISVSGHIGWSAPTLSFSNDCN